MTAPLINHGSLPRAIREREDARLAAVLATRTAPPPPPSAQVPAPIVGVPQTAREAVLALLADRTDWTAARLRASLPPRVTNAAAYAAVRALTRAGIARRVTAASAPGTKGHKRVAAWRLA